MARSRSTTRLAIRRSIRSIASIGGVPYVAFSQYDGSNAQVRVSRLDDAGTAWVEVDGGPSPINETPTLDGFLPSVTVSDGVPVVAWVQAEATTTPQVRVSQNVAVFSGVPDTVITSGPTSSIGAFARFEFTAIPPEDATFECALDGAAFAPCTSPYDSPALSSGTHVFVVRASNFVRHRSDAGFADPGGRPVTAGGAAPSHRHDGGVGCVLTGVGVDLDVTDAAPSSGIRNRFCVVDPPTPPTSFGAFGSQPCGVTVTASGNHVVTASPTIRPATRRDRQRGVPHPAAAGHDDHERAGAGVVVGAAVRVHEHAARCQLRVPGGWRSVQGLHVAVRRYNLPLGAHTLYVRAVTIDGATDPTPATYAFELAERTVRSSCSFSFRSCRDSTKGLGKAAPVPNLYCDLVRTSVPMRSLILPPAGACSPRTATPRPPSRAPRGSTTRSSSRATCRRPVGPTPRSSPSRLPRCPWSGTSSSLVVESPSTCSVGSWTWP